MSWNGLDIVVFYESARGDNIFGQTATGAEEYLSWVSVGAGGGRGRLSYLQIF